MHGTPACLAFLPGYLLQEAYLAENLERAERVFILEFLLAYLQIYQEMCQYEAKTPGKKQKDTKDSKMKAETQRLRMFRSDWIQRFLCVIACLIDVLVQYPCAFSLAAFCSHLIEHFFGMMRRLSGGQDISPKFFDVAVKCILARKAEAKEGIVIKSGKRMESSGVDIFDELVRYEYPTQVLRGLVLMIFKQHGCPEEHLRKVFSSYENDINAVQENPDFKADPFQEPTIEMLFPFLPELETPEMREYVTLKSTYTTISTSCNKDIHRANSALGEALGK